MIIKKNTKVSLSCVLKTKDNRVIYTSENEGPLTFTVGNKEVMPGMEKAVTGREPGFSCIKELAPEEAFGEYRSDYVIPYHINHFSHLDNIKPGDTISFQKENCRSQEMRVLEIMEDTVIADGNHPWAGETVIMEFEILSTEAGTQTKGCRGCSVKGGCGKCSS